MKLIQYRLVSWNGVSLITVGVDKQEWKPKLQRKCGNK